MAEVRLQGVSKVFDGGQSALSDVTLAAEDGEFLVLLGPSGCGKSTLLRVIAGLEEATTGDIFIGGTRVNHVPPKDRDIAMVFQNYALYPHMTVYKNMAFGLMLRHVPRSEIDRRVNEAAEILGIKHLLDRKPKALSGGERQRVAVGRAIVRQPKVFLFDEPLSNLDAQLRVQMRSELLRLHQRLGTTMIYVTHDQVEAMTMGQRVAVLFNGRVQQVDSPLSVYHKPSNRFVAGFVGSPAMNFLDGEVHNEHDGTVSIGLFDGTCRIALPTAYRALLEPYVGKKIDVGVRPEALGIAVDSPPHCDAISGRITLVETLGADMNVFVEFKGQTLVIRASAMEQYRPGASAWVTLPPEALYFFDPKSGTRIAP